MTWLITFDYPKVAPLVRLKCDANSNLRIVTDHPSIRPPDKVVVRSLEAKPWSENYLIPAHNEIVQSFQARTPLVSNSSRSPPPHATVRNSSQMSKVPLADLLRKHLSETQEKIKVDQEALTQYVLSRMHPLFLFPSPTRANEQLGTIESELLTKTQDLRSEIV